MVAMNRARVAWSGFQGAPGVSTFYFGSTTTDMGALKTFFQAMAPFVPTVVQMLVPALGDQVNDTDGQITGAWTGTNGGNVPGAGGAGGYSAPSGIVIDWLSAAVIDGRRRQGRTFFVPIKTASYQTDGSIVEADRATILAAATTLIAAYAGELKVFSRPYAGRAAVLDGAGNVIKPAKPPRVGAAVTVVAARVPDIAAVLRSRRS